MLNEYPAVPLSSALRVANLTPSEVAYGIHNGFIKADVDTLSVPADTGRSSALAGKELAEARDVLFRLLIVNLHKIGSCAIAHLERAIFSFLILRIAHRWTSTVDDCTVLSPALPRRKSNLNSTPSILRAK